MSVHQRQPEFDLVELSDRAWEVIDPTGRYDDEERRWVDALTAKGRSVAGLPALGARLEQVGDAVGTDDGRVPPRMTGLVMMFLASHPAIHELSAALLRDALHDGYGAIGVPPEIRGFLTERNEMLDAHVRRHGAVQPRRHLHSKRMPPDGAPSA